MISIIPKLLNNSLFSLTSDILQKASNTLLFILVSHWLGEREAGIFALSLTFLMLFTQLSFWGLDQLLIREVAKDVNVTGEYLGHFLLVRLLVSIILYGLLGLILSFGFNYPADTTKIILIMGGAILFDSLSNIYQSLFVAFERLGFLLIVSLLIVPVRLLISIIALVAGLGLETLAILSLAFSILSFIINLIIAYLYFPHPILNLHLNFLREQFSEAKYFFFIGIFYILEFQLDVLLLSLFRNEAEVGTYNAATTFLFALVLIPQAIRLAVFPFLTHAYQYSRLKLQSLVELLYKYLLLIALPVALLISLSAEPIIRIVFQQKFGDAALVLRIVIWTFVLLMINVPPSRLLVVSGQQRLLAWFQAGSLLVNLLINVILIPQMGPLGVAWARLASTFVFVGLTFSYVYFYVMKWNLNLNLWLLVAGLGLTYVVTKAGLFINFPLAIFLGSLSYCASLILFRVIDRQELNFARKLLAHYLLPVKVRLKPTR